MINLFSLLMTKLKYSTNLINLEKNKGSILIAEKRNNPDIVITANLINGDPHVLRKSRFNPLNRLENKKTEMMNSTILLFTEALTILIGVLILYIGKTKYNNIFLQSFGIIIMIATIVFSYFSQSRTHISKDAALFSLIEFASTNKDSDATLCFINSTDQFVTNNTLKSLYPNSLIILINQLIDSESVTCYYTSDAKENIMTLKDRCVEPSYLPIESEYESIIYPINRGVILTTTDSTDNKTIFPGSKEDIEVDVELFSYVPKMLKNFERR